MHHDSRSVAAAPHDIGIAESALMVVQITDAHLQADPQARLLGVDTDCSLRGVLGHLSARELRVDLVLATGDIAQDGSIESYQRFLKLAGKIPAPLRGLPGNHDNSENLRAAWGSRVQPVLDIGRWRIIMLDSTVPGSNDGHLAQDQLALLATEAAQAGDRHVLVAMHHHPVAMQCDWLDTTIINNARELFECVGNLPAVRGLLWGHVHQEFDAIHCYPPHGPGVAAHRHLRLLASPSTCVQFVPRSHAFKLDTAAPAYRWLKLHADGVIESGVQYVPGLNIVPDMDSAGY